MKGVNYSSSRTVLCSDEEMRVHDAKCFISGLCRAKEGIQVDQSKVAAIRNWPQPKIITEIRSFHGLTSFYRRFIPHFSSVMAPVADCMKGKKFSWTEEAGFALERIKELLTSAPILVLPDFQLLFELHTDASKVGIGRVLSQKGRQLLISVKNFLEQR